VHAELVEDAARVVQHVHHVRHRRALVAADVGHARLQQRFGDREDALAAEGFAFAELEQFHFLLEGAFHRHLSRQTSTFGNQTAMAGMQNTSASSSTLIAR
jgi:hypothetical protein